MEVQRMGNSFELRDRDAIVVDEGLIFRVYGYFHPPSGYVCDVEYAPSEIFKSTDPRAIRRRNSKIFYKFYADEGLKFVMENYPEYTVFYEPLQRRLVGVESHRIKELRKPEVKLQELLQKTPRDELLSALHRLIEMVTRRSHRSHNLRKKQLAKLCEALEEIYREKGSPLRNEFESEEAIKGKRWRFLNYGPKEFLQHQRRKMVYAVFHDRKIGRPVKVEFEPVKDWSEIFNEYDSQVRIIRKGWVKAIARVVDDSDAPFIPSIYKVEILKVIDGSKSDDIQRIVSYVEEFRMQAKKDEVILVEGNLERVETPTESFHQITLTYGPRYYEQVLKTI